MHIKLFFWKEKAKGLLRMSAVLGDIQNMYVAIGGGEPLLRPDLPLIVQAANSSGLGVHITTGLIEDFDFTILKQLVPAVKF